MGKLDNKKVIITGGSRGIGKAIALAYAKEGADIIINFQTNEQEAQKVVAEIISLGRKAIAIKADITKSEDRGFLVNEAKKFLGVIDILVNNAGIYFQTDYLQISETDFDKIIATNLKGAFFLSQLVCQEMIARNAGGSIINISSFRDKSVTSGLAHYQSSKAALTMFSKSIALEMAKHKIRVNTISPGTLTTDINLHIRQNKPDEWAARQKTIPLGYIGDPEKVCGLAVLLASGDGEYATGSRFLVDGGRSLQQAVIQSKL